MAISVLGSGAITGASPQDITVQVGTQRTVFFWAGFNSTPLDLTAITLGGDALTQHAKVTDGSGSGVSTGTASRADPSTGTQSMAWTWNVAPSEGPVLFYVNFQGAQADVDVAGSIAEGDGDANVSSAVGDYAAALFQAFGASVDTTGYTEIAGPSSVNGETGVVVTKTATSPTTDFVMDGGDLFPSIAAIALRESGGAGGGGGATVEHISTLAFPSLARRPVRDTGGWLRSQGGLYVPPREPISIPRRAA